MDRDERPEGAVITTREYPSGPTIPCPASPYAAPDGSTATWDGTTDPLGQEIGGATRSTDDWAIAGAAAGTSPSATADLPAGAVDASADSIGDPVQAPASESSVEWDVHFPNASLTVTRDEDQSDPYVPTVVHATPAGSASGAFGQSAVSSGMVFDGEVDVLGASPAFDVRELLQLHCHGGSSCDSGASTTLRLTLPPRVSYTSTSGVFLTAPEPEDSAQGLAGVTVVALGARTRRGGDRRTRGRG